MYEVKSIDYMTLVNMKTGEKIFESDFKSLKNLPMSNVPRKARATKRGKIHYAYGNMSLCLLYVGEEVVKGEEIDCKRCLSKMKKIKNVLKN